MPEVRDGFRLGEWLVDPSLNRLSSGTEIRQLEPKIMDVLVFLAERAGKVVSKQQIIDAVWAKRFVAESVLSRAIAEIRRALGDAPRSPRFLETISKRGYRLLAPVAPAARGMSLPEQTLSSFLVLIGDEEVCLVEGENIIGRGDEARVRLASQKASRRHARIVVDSGRALLEDLGSKNGTWLRGEKVLTPTELADGDEIVIGPEAFILHSRHARGTTLTDKER